MKPKTKKILIIMAAVAIVAAIVYFAFFRKKGWEKEIEKLNISDANKDRLKIAVKQILSDPSYIQSENEALAASSGLTYDQWLVLEASQNLGWVNGLSNGQLDIRPSIA